MHRTQLMYCADVSTTAALVEPSPTDFLQLAGHRLRWRLLGELARSDRTVHELTELVGQPQNLVSYHLGKLRTAGLVSTRRSSADGRDAYYAADLTRIGALLSSTAQTLHPGLVRPQLPDGRPLPGTPERARVLFLCTGNSARSQIAEALLRERSGGLVGAASAGSHPKPLHPDAVRAAAEVCGIDLGGQRSKHLGVFADERFDWVITLCDRVREVCPEFPGHPEAVHWSMPDPSAAGGGDAGYAAFRRTATELESRVAFLLAVIADRGPHPHTHTRKEEQ
jgi:protein-tyrosine-phosphatase/DNA-binding transcriptional ArsR family regulator